MKNIQVLTIAALLVVSCANPTSRFVSDKTPVSVKVLSVEDESSVQTRTYIGEVSSSRTAILSAPYPGTLKQLNVKVGNIVSKGSVVADVSSQTVQSSYEMAAATLKQAEDGYARAKAVYEKGGMAEVKFIEVETALAKARASESAASSALSSGKVKSPFSGVVSEVYPQQGTELTIGAPLVKIIDRSSLEISFPVPETELHKINKGMSAKVDIPALNLVGLAAKVVSKGVEAAPLSHTYDCSLLLADKVKELAPGMVCKVYLESDSTTGIVLPTQVVQTEKDGRYVWVVTDGLVEKRSVQVGGFCGAGVIIESGLNKGDSVISEGFRKVSSGMKVKVVE